MTLSAIHRFTIAIFALAWTALTVVPSADAAPKKKTQRPRDQRTVTFNVGLSVTYDDNIIRYSDADLELFEDEASPWKFSIQSKDDWIITPRISPRITARLIGDQIGWLDLGFMYYGYATNDVRRYSRFSIGARQYVTPKWYGELTYAFIPSYYYRNYQLESNGSSAVTYAEAKFAKHMINLQTGYDVLRNLSATAAYQYQYKSYNDEFEFRNLNGHGFELGTDWRPVRKFRLWGSYGFERATARGAEMPEDILDISYDTWGIEFGIRHYMEVLNRIRPEPFVSFSLRGTRYQTDRYTQVYYFGREDLNYLARVGLSGRLPFFIRGSIEYSYAKKDADLPDIYPNLIESNTTSELEQKLNYQSNSVTIRFTRDF